MNPANAVLSIIAPAAVLALLPAAAQAESLPPSVAAIIDAAAATYNPATLSTVVDLVKKTNPASLAEIDAQVTASKAKAEKARLKKIATQGFLEGIKGEGQIGFSNSTGGTKTVSLALGLKLSQETLHWKNALTLKADFERENGVTSEEKLFAGYEGRYKFSARRYGLTTLSWDRDPFSGYSGRAAGSVGLGYKLIDRPNMSFSIDSGPAIRRIAYVATAETAANTTTEAAGRAGAAFSWTFLPRTTLTEDTAAYFGSADKSVSSTIAVTTKVAGAVSARLSYELDYDSLLPPGYNDIDTLGRLTLVYGF